MCFDFKKSNEVKVSKTLSQLYNELYSKGYGTSHATRSAEPFIDMYFSSGGSAFDYGCGRGDLVRLMRSKKFDAVGFDIIDRELVHDDISPFYINLSHRVDERVFKLISQSIWDYSTCFDVLEHLEPEKVPNVVRFIARSTRIVSLISVCHRASHVLGPNNEQLHLTIKTPMEWTEVFLSSNFKIVDRYDLPGDSTMFVLVPNI